MTAPRSLWFFVWLAAALSSVASAQSFLTRWTFDGADAADMSVTTGFGAGVGAPATASDAFSSVSVGTGAAEGYAPSILSYVPGDYFQFSLSLSASNDWVVDKISLVSSSFLNGATNWEVRSSLDGYAMVLGTGLTNGHSATSLNSLGLDVGGGEAFTFRVYGLGGLDDTFKGFSVDNVTVSGALGLSPVPEPSTYAALMGVGVLGLAGWRRRRGAVVRAVV